MSGNELSREFVGTHITHLPEGLTFLWMSSWSLSLDMLRQCGPFRTCRTKLQRMRMTGCETEA